MVKNVDRMVQQGGYNQAEVPPELERIREFEPEREKEIEQISDLVIDSLKEGKIKLDEASVLDMGSGIGIFEENMQDRGVRQVITVDSAKEVVKHLNEKFSDSPEIKAVVGDFSELPVQDGSIDAAVSLGTVAEIPPDSESEDKFLAEIGRVLKEEGFCIIDSVSNSENDFIQRQFEEQRQKEMKSWQDHKGPVTQRKFVFQKNLVTIVM